MAEHEGTIYGAMVHRHYHDRDRDCGRRDWDRSSGLEEVIADGVQRLQHDVPEQAAALKDSIQASTNSATDGFRHVVDIMCQDTNRITHGLRDNAEAIGKAECEIIREIGNVRFEGAKTESKLIERMDYESDQVKSQLTGFERSVDKQFCETKEAIKDSERRLFDKLCDMENERKNDLISELRATSRNRDLEIAIERNNVAFSNQLQMINSQLIQLDNGLDNKITNKIVQIGAGLVAAPLNTQNNVK